MPPCACKPYFALKDKPITQEHLARWAEYATLNLFSYGFGNYEAAFKQASHFFTPQGWEQVQSDLMASGNIDTVIDNKLLVSSEILEPAFLIRQTDKNEWLYRLRVAVSYDNADKRVNQIMSVDLRLKKYRPPNTVSSIGVHQLVASVVE